MIFIKILSILVMLFYALGSAGVFWGIPAERYKILVLGKFFTWTGFALHTLLIISIILLNGADDLSRGYFMQLLAWCILLAYFIGWRLLKSGFLSLTASPLALLLFILALKVDKVQIEMPGTLKELFIALHIGPMYTSLGLLTLAFGAALLFLHMDRKIKSKTRLTEFDRGLPALGTYDRINHLAVVFGFPLYTLGIAAGFIWAPLTWGREGGILGSWDPKEIFSVFVWFLYASTFYLRILRGWRGRKAALLILFIFGISAFSLLGVNLFMPTHHSFGSLATFTA
ncbi:MAG: cytochrome c biogenesis protein [Deltaproteobacteria bacterium]|jgi:ABC-type transport system involved in cytochrome c biogenesis permease subunit|nr:cytochrome c biogenesis protein [Deltaproteobacteria bacterium]